MNAQRTRKVFASFFGDILSTKRDGNQDFYLVRRQLSSTKQ